MIMKTSQAESRGATIAYDEVGTGVPVVLLHAFPFDREMWAPQRDGLAAVARIFAPDFPLFGQSTASREVFTMDSAADTIADFLTKIGVTEKVVLGGLSMGGYVAMAFARRHADRLRGLIFADTKSDPDDDTAKANREKTIALAREKGTAAVVETMLPKLLSDETRKLMPDVVETAKTIGNRQSVAAVTMALAALRDRPDSNPGLASITVPTLVIVGEHDAITPPAAASKIANAVPGSKLVTIPGAGHLSNLENPVAFNTTVRSFLESLGA
jgi:3-oxoadipate enol-lactonase